MADASHAASLTVLGGPQKGRRHDFEDVVEEVFIGSDSDCQFCLDLPGVSPIHARVWLEEGVATVHDTHSPAGVFVNDDRVNESAPLRDGDFLWLGSPGAEESVLLQFRGAALTEDAQAEPAVEVSPNQPAEEWVIEEAPAGAMPAAADSPADWFFEEAEANAPAGAAPSGEPSTGSVEEPSVAQEFFFEDEPVPPPAVPAPAGGSAFDEFLLEEGVEAKPAEEPLVLASSPTPTRSSVQAPPASRPAAPAPPALEWDEEALLAVDAAPQASRPKAQPPTPTPPKEPGPVAASPPPPPAVAPRAATAPSAPRPSVSTAGTSAAAGRSRRPAPPPPARRKAGAGVARMALMVVVLAGVLGGGGFAAWWFLLRGPRIDSANPAKLRPGETVTLKGENFAADAARNQVRFGGEKLGRVIQASPTELQVEVPDIASAPGKEEQVPVVISVDGRASPPFQLMVTAAPRIHGVSPSVAMPDEEVTLVGGGWGSGVVVRFGSVEAQVVEVRPEAVRVRVPALAEPVGTQLQVVVSMAGIASNSAPFAIGHVPLLIGIAPAEANPGDVVLLTGRGFHLRASANQLRIGGALALVLHASDTEIKAVVPRGVGAAEAPVELRVPGSEHVGQGRLALGSLPDALDFRFVAEPFSDGNAHDHASLSTGLGPAFVLSASGGRSAGDRALEAQGRLNAAAAALRGGTGPDITVRLDERPAVILGGNGSPLLEVTPEDAAAYDEEWAQARGKSVPATPLRLALWWGAVTRDLALALARGERPKHASSLAPEGRALTDLFDAVKKASKTGLNREAVAKVKPPIREAARAAVLRLPASVLPPAAPAATGPAQAAPSAAPRLVTLRLEGVWSGVERDAGETRYVSVTFTRGGGSLTYERALSLTVPLLSVEQPQKGSLRYSLRSGNSTRYYSGKWDGQKIQGKICPEADCKTATGTFELAPSR